MGHLLSCLAALSDTTAMISRPAPNLQRAPLDFPPPPRHDGRGRFLRLFLLGLPMSNAADGSPGLGHLLDIAFTIPASARNLAGFREWAKSEDFPQRGRICFLDRELFIDLSPEELESHVKVKFEVGVGLSNLNKKFKLGEFYAGGTLLTNQKANLSTEPDGVFLTWEAMESGRVRLVPLEGEEGQYLEVEGTPDWVLEVVSKYSVRKDTQRLRSLYFRAGIPEYWLIDARGEEIVFQILRRGVADYEEQLKRGGWKTSPLFRRRFRLVRQRGRLDHWEYTLQVKSIR
jgi:Uma2 family endonuclease